MTSTETYAYDGEGRRVRELFGRSDGKAGNADFHRDAKGRRVATDCRQYKGWFSGRIEYAHADGRLAGARILRNGAAIGRIEPPPRADDPGSHPALVTELNAALTPLPAGDPLQWSDEDLSWLDRFAGAKVLALGEAAHGTRELSMARRRIFRYLAQHHDYRVLAMEAHFCESLRLVRDRPSTEYVPWDFGLLGDEAKIVLWAHNEHVLVHEGNAGNDDGGLGWQLRQRLGDRYRVVGLLFVRREFRAKVFDAGGEVTGDARKVVFDVEPPAGTLNHLLTRAAAASYVLDLGCIREGSGRHRRLMIDRAVLGCGRPLLRAAEGRRAPLRRRSGSQCAHRVRCRGFFQ